MANVGQLKQVFSFDIVYPQVVALSGQLQMNVTSQTAGGYWQWIMQFDQLSEVDQQFEATPANDGIPNLLKYVMGLEPPDQAHNASMPQPDENYVPPGEQEECRALWFDRPENVFGVTYILDVSTDLAEWNEVFEPRIETSASSAPTGYERVWMFEDIPSNELPSPYFQRLRIVLHDPGDPGCTIHSLLALDSNMFLFGMVEYIGEEVQRGCFIDGKNFGLAIDEGYLFSTGIAKDWNVPDTNKEYSTGGIRDEDLEEWMFAEGFPRFENETKSASGVRFKFEVDFNDPLVELGTVEVPFIFASEEYYQPPAAQPDGMAIFLFELNASGDIIPETRTNIGLLQETETHSRAVNVFNAGEVVGDPGEMEHNIGESGFTDNNDYSWGLGYSGYTGRLKGEGGPAKVFEDLEITALVRQDEFGIDGQPGWEVGGGGVLFRARYNSAPFINGDELSGYVVAFGREREDFPEIYGPGDDRFLLYKLKNHRFLFIDHPGPIADLRHLTPEKTDLILDSVTVDFDPSKWYYIKVETEGGTIRARFWEEGTSEPESWQIEYTDPEPFVDGFVGAVHTDVYEGHATQWDTFEVKVDGQNLTDFSGYSLGVSPSDWTALSSSGDFWSVEADGAATGGRVLGHMSEQEVDVQVDVLRWDSVEVPPSIGLVEAGKSYLMKIVLADAVDERWHSALFLENGGIRVKPVEPE